MFFRFYPFMAPVTRCMYIPVKRLYVSRYVSAGFSRCSQCDFLSFSPSLEPRASGSCENVKSKEFDQRPLDWCKSRETLKQYYISLRCCRCGIVILIAGCWYCFWHADEGNAHWTGSETGQNCLGWICGYFSAIVYRPKIDSFSWWWLQYFLAQSRIS